MMMNLERDERRALLHLQRALETLMAFDSRMSVTQVVAFIHLVSSPEPITVRKLGDLLGRDRGAALVAMGGLQDYYTLNGTRHEGVNFLQRIGKTSEFKLTARGAAVVRSIAALLQ